MRLIKKTAWCLLVASLAIASPSCGKDDPATEPTPTPGGNTGTDPNPNPTPDEPKPSEGVFAPEDAKQHVENTAMKFMNLFDAADQQRLADLAEYVADRYGELHLPYGWETDDSYYAPAAFVSAAARMYRTASYAPLSRSVYTYRFADYAGIYEPGSYRWEKTGTSDDVIFRFAGKRGACELKATASTDGWEATYDDDDYGDRYTGTVPRLIHITLTEGGTTLADISVESKVDFDMATADIKVNATVMNLAAEVTFSGTDTRLTEQQTLKINGNVCQTSTATVNGYNMLRENTIRRLANESLKPADVFAGASGTVDILGALQVRGEVAHFSSIASIADDLDYNAWEWGVYTKSDAEHLCRTFCDKVNANVDTRVYFNGTDAVQAIGVTLPYYYEYSDGEWYWEAHLGLRYVSDNSTQDFDAFLDNYDTTSVENRFTSLVRAYRRLWDIF